MARPQRFLRVLPKEIEEIRREEEEKRVKTSAYQQKLDQLAALIPKDKFANMLEWSLYCRPTVQGRANILKYLKFWHDIYRDDWHYIILLIARQMGKSTYAATRKGYAMTRRSHTETLYITYEDESLRVFSKKFRSMWKESPILSQFVKGSTLGSVTTLELINDSIAWLVTHAHDFHHVEGKSTHDQIWDELQNLDLESWVKAMEAQSFTHGKFIGMGIGGFVDTIHHRWWKATDQREWIPDDQSVYVDSAGKEWPGQGWRKRLQFDTEKPYDCLIWDEYLIKDGVLDGHWNPTQPKNSDKHGYHLTQYMAPWIPLSKADAVKLYKLDVKESIEYKLEHYPYTDFQRHVLAEFAAGEVKPFPREALYAICDPKRRFLRPSEVDYKLGDLYLGADWGGGKRTVVWIYQVVNEQYPVLVLINAKRLTTPNVNKQYEEVAEWIDDYSVRQAVVDGGGGIHQVQQLEERYGDRCVKFFYLKRPAEPGPKDRKEEIQWRRQNMWQYDKSWLMQRVEDYIKRPAVEGTSKIRRIVWPGADMQKIEWIIDQFVVEETETVSLSGGGQYLRYFNPSENPDLNPDDALHAQNFSIVAWDLGRKKMTGHVGGGLPGNNDNDNDNNTSYFGSRLRYDSEKRAAASYYFE